MTIRYGLNDPDALRQAAGILYWNALAFSVVLMLVDVAASKGIAPKEWPFITLIYLLIPVGLLMATVGRRIIVVRKDLPNDNYRVIAYAAQVYGLMLASCGVASFVATAFLIATGSA